MIFVEPTQVFFDEMIGNHNDCLMFELRSFPGVSKVTISVVTLFSLASEICAKRFRHILVVSVQMVDGHDPKVEHTQNFFLFWQQYQPLPHDKASFASDNQQNFPRSYQVL